MIRNQKKTSKTTTDSRTYNLTRRQMVTGCNICRPHQGCNSTRRWAKHNNWKLLRKTQWRD